MIAFYIGCVAGFVVGVILALFLVGLLQSAKRGDEMVESDKRL